MQKNYFIHTLVVLAVVTITLAFVFSKIQYDIFLLQEIQTKKNQDFSNKILFSKFECSFPSDVVDEPILQAIKGQVYGIGQSYVPEDLAVIPSRLNNTQGRDILVHSDVRPQLILMLDEARAQGVQLGVNSAYRDFDRQKRIFENPINHDPEQEFDTAARPGFSEHQLGTAVDISAPIFSNLSTINRGYDWLAQNAHEYGFTLSYPKGSEPITGFRYEPWHHRYVGVELAKILKQDGELFNEKIQAFYVHPFLEGKIAPHTFIADNVYASLVSQFGNKIILSQDFFESVMTSENLQKLVNDSQSNSAVEIELLSQEGEPVIFDVTNNSFQIGEVEYEQRVVKTDLENGNSIFVSIVKLKQFDAYMLFAHVAEFDQSEILGTHIFENCR